MDSHQTGPPKTVKEFMVAWAKSTATNLGVFAAMCMAVLFSVYISSLVPSSSLNGGSSDPPAMIEEVVVYG